MTDTQYYLYEDKNLQPIVENAYERLAAAYDIVVLEGAGSPAEVNPNEHDLVNMMANMSPCRSFLSWRIWRKRLSRGPSICSMPGSIRWLSSPIRRLI